MSGIKGVMKSGWHPEGKGGPGTKESWRGDNKGINQVAGWVGKGKSEPTQNQQASSSSTLGRLKARGTGLVGRGPNATEQAYNHQSTPLSSLRDPSAFAPPPKRVDYQGSAAVPHAVPSGDTHLGGALSPTQVQGQREAAEAQSLVAEQETVGQDMPSQVPYRADTTGLSTSHLPTPPLKRAEHESVAGGRRAQVPPLPRGAKPSLPPRLPPRQNSNPGRHTPLPPPPYSAATESTPVKDDYLTAELTRKLNQPPTRNDGQLNQESSSRLARAGVSVPGLQIGGNSAFANPWSEERPSTAQTPTMSPASAGAPQLGGLQNKFSKMSTSSPKPESPSQGTTFAQKQAALKTATSFRNDPSSVSLTDARSAASTANNFKERHGDQVTSGLRTANGMNQKYDISNKLNSYATGSPASSVPESPGVPLSSRPMASSPVLGSSEDTVRKNPPPPPPKRKPHYNGSEALPSLPSLPLNSKPVF
ncbi:MAG: hypothetical protein M1812_002164 [Candelaria pacifica]|nr:MAG: hypothetical protein M1812_002164 [Candelaria pacifica]